MQIVVVKQDSVDRGARAEIVGVGGWLSVPPISSFNPFERLNKVRVLKFMNKLFAIVNDSKIDQIISWSPLVIA